MPAHLLLVTWVLALAGGVAIAAAHAAVSSPYALANRCSALRSTATGRYVALSGSGAYTARSARLAGAVPLYLKPTGLGTYMLYDRERGLLAESGNAVTRTNMPGPPAQWRIAKAPGPTFTLTSTADGRQLEASPSGSLTLVPAGSAGNAGRFTFPSDRGCAVFPEAAVGALGRARSSVNPEGTVFGWAVVPTYPSGKVCNAKGLTRLGAYLIEQMIARHFMVMIDHMSESARESVLAIAARAHYPLISPHTDTGGTWVPQDLQRLYGLGGLATITPDAAPSDVEKIVALTRYRSPNYYFGVGFGTDTGGFGSLPGPDAAEQPLSYPFTAYDGVRFVRQRTGEKTYDLNTDGVAHYGLMPDLIAEMQQQPGGRATMPILYNSAEAYLEAWQRAWTHT